MTEQRASLRRRMLVRSRLLVQATGFDVVREPFRTRFIPALADHGVTAALDIGANRGQFAHELRRSGFSGPIVSVEPLRDAFSALGSAAAGDALWATEQAAVGASVGELVMNVSQNSVSSSVLPILARSVAAAPQTQYVATETVAATTVDELVERHRLNPSVTLLKIDVQGFESAVLDGASATLSRFAALRLEMSLVPLYEGEQLMPEMVSRLSEAGFDLWHIDPGFVEPSTGRLLQLDGTFFQRG
jgi:FkbM family methyltransferase